MFMLIALVLEISLGFLQMDNRKFWGFTFVVICFISSLFQLCAASLAVEGAKNTYDSDFVDGTDNIYAGTFFLYLAPICTRIMLGLLKFKDVRQSGGGNLEG